MKTCSVCTIIKEIVQVPTTPNCGRTSGLWSFYCMGLAQSCCGHKFHMSASQDLIGRFQKLNRSGQGPLRDVAKGPGPRPR